MQPTQSDKPILSIVAVLGLLITGIVTQPTPLKTARPIYGGEPTEVPWGDERIPARLWQDPLATSYAAAEKELQRMIDHCQALGNSNSEREFHAKEVFDSLPLSNSFWLGKNETTVLPVLLPPVGYSGDRETRLRIRSGVLSALMEERFVPEQSNRLGYIWHKLPNARLSVDAQAGAESSAPAGTELATDSKLQIEPQSPGDASKYFERLVHLPRTHHVVPFEWFKESGKGAEHRRHVVVLWLDEEKLQYLIGDTLGIVQSFFDGTKALTDAGQAGANVLTEMVQKLSNPSRADFDPAPSGAGYGASANGQRPVTELARQTPTTPRVRIIGPTSSTGLFRILREPSKASWRLSSFGDEPDSLAVFSPFATIRDEKLRRATGEHEPRGGAPIDFGVPLERTPVTDDVLMDAIVRELEERGFDREAGNRFFLISEWDSQYGRDIRNAFKASLIDRGFKNSYLQWYSYLRGLDGVSSGEASGAPSAAGNTDKPDGPSQLDSLRRQVERIIEEAHQPSGMTVSEEHQTAPEPRERERSARSDREVHAAQPSAVGGTSATSFASVSNPEGGRIAIGIVGSDEYDKLLVLQALRPAFPDVLFFTTDLDARFAHPSQIQWTRNLVVASSYGLFQKESQASTAPFRNAYTSSVFAACRRALNWTADEDASKANADVLRDASQVPASTERARQPGFKQQQEGKTMVPVHADLSLYEIGSHGATRLPPTRNPDELYKGYGPGAYSWGARQQRIRKATRKASIGILALGLGLFAMGMIALGLRRRRPFKVIPYLDDWLNQALDPHALNGKSGDGLDWILKHSRELQLLNLGLFTSLLGVVGILAELSAEPIALFQGISIWPTEAIRVIAMYLCVQYLLISLRRVHVAQARATQEFGLPGRGRGADWKAYERQSRTWSRLKRTLAWSVAYGCLAIVLDQVFGMPEAPARGDLAILTDRILNLACWSFAAYLLFFVFDATLLRTQMVRIFMGSEPQFGGEDKGASASYEECREVRYVGVVTEAESRIVIYPFVILLLVAASRYELFDAWYWNLPLALAIGLAFLVVIWSGLNLRSSAERLRRNSLRAIQQEIHQCEQKLGRAELVEKLKGFRAEVTHMRNGAFASLTGNPILQGLMIPLGGLGGVTMLESLVK